MRMRTSPPFGFGVSLKVFCSGLPCSTISQLSISRFPLILTSCPGRFFERLVDVPQDVVDRLKPDRHAHHVGRDAGLDLIGFFHLPVRGGGGMDDERLRVADVGEVAHELRRLDEALARLASALYAEVEQSR